MNTNNINVPLTPVAIKLGLIYTIIKCQNFYRQEDKNESRMRIDSSGRFRNGYQLSGPRFSID